LNLTASASERMYMSFPCRSKIPGIFPPGGLNLTASASERMYMSFSLQIEASPLKIGRAGPPLAAGSFNARMTGDDFERGLILNINKPGGWTSFDVIRRIRRMTGFRKIGHGGTLDPMARGVLLICTGKATKEFDRLLLLEKVYEGTIELGIQTDTDDIEGRVLGRSPVPAFDSDTIREALSRFNGEVEQIPPAFSAVKMKGKPLYRMARKGMAVEPKARKVRIFESTILKWEKPLLDFRIRCGKGTYIRALARDMGQVLGTGGTLKALTRTRVGPYTLEEALTLEQLEGLCFVNESLSNP